MSKMASHEPFGHLQLKLWAKERPGVKLAHVPDVRSGSVTWRWKALFQGYNFGLDLVPIGGQGKEL
jgi:hypothetical protein